MKEVWRYPVKSLQGERLSTADLGPEGIAGDRHYAIFDAVTGLGLTARREPSLLWASASLVSGALTITLPDGTTATDDAALSDWLDRPVELRGLDDSRSRRYENAVDFETQDAWTTFDGARGTFRDSERVVVSLVSTGTLGSWDARRFRPNLVLEGAGEESLVGSRVSLGSAVLELSQGIGRCVLVTRPQPGGIEKDLDVLRTVHRAHGGTLAVGATVVVPGVVSVGDRLLA